MRLVRRSSSAVSSFRDGIFLDEPTSLTDFVVDANSSLCMSRSMTRVQLGSADGSSFNIIYSL